MVVPLGVYLIVLIMATVTMDLPGDTDDTDTPVATDTFLTDTPEEPQLESAARPVLESDAPLAAISTRDAELTAPAVLESDAPLAATVAMDAEATARTLELDAPRVKDATRTAQVTAPAVPETPDAESDAHAAEPNLVADNLADTNAPPPTKAVDEHAETAVTPAPETILPESAPTVTSQSEDEPETASQESIGPIEFPAKGSPKYAFDYRGRLWVEKKRKSFFRQLRRPQIPPEEPG